MGEAPYLAIRATVQDQLPFVRSMRGRYRRIVGRLQPLTVIAIRHIGREVLLDGRRHPHIRALHKTANRIAQRPVARSARRPEPGQILQLIARRGVSGAVLPHRAGIEVISIHIPCLDISRRGPPKPSSVVPDLRKRSAAVQVGVVHASAKAERAVQAVKGIALVGYGARVSEG